MVKKACLLCVREGSYKRKQQDLMHRMVRKQGAQSEKDIHAYGEGAMSVRKLDASSS